MTLTFTTSESTLVLVSLSHAPITLTSPTFTVHLYPDVYKIETETSISFTSDGSTSDFGSFSCPSTECPSIKQVPPEPPSFVTCTMTELETFFGRDASKAVGFPTSHAAVAVAP
ncbi:MAG TPA: hypothetical protein VFP84_36065 [Kofleriaceae bacterium]|nr:hypothetical protein [Kofleriaceae bacterium]